jgi:hypothetical protein
MKKNTLLIFLLVSFLNAYSQICNSVTNGAFSTNSSGWTITPGTGTWVRSGSFGGIILVTTDNSTQSLSQSINGLSNTPVSNQVDLYFDLYASNNGGTTGASVSDLSVSLNGTIYAIFSNPTGTASITATSQNGSSISNFSTGVTPTGLTLISRQIKISIPYTGPNSATLEFLHNSPTSGTDNWGLDNIKIDTVCAAVCPYALPVSSAAAFQCPLNLVEVVGKRPVTKGYLYNQLWYGTDDIGDSSENAPPAIQSSWSSAFRITDAFGLPAHPFSPTDSGILVDPNLGFKDNSTLLNPFPGSPTNFVGRENGQQDGWLMIPPGLTCIGFRIGGSNNLFRESSALYAGRDLSNLTFVGEKHYANSSNFLDTTYILPTNLMTIGNCGWKVLRIRFYHHDPKITSNSNVLWNIGDGFVVIPYEYMQPVSNPLLDDNIPTVMQYSRSRLAYQDAKGDVYARNTNSSVGSAFALDPRFCESINVLETNVRANGNCNPVFSCGITPVKVEGYSSASTTPYFLNRCWYNTDDIGSDIQWFAPPQLGTDSGSFYGPIDIFGLPTFGTSTSPTNANNTAIQTIGVDDGGSSLLPINSGVTGRENVQQDGWLAVPNYINCINFRKPASNANSSGFYIIEQDSTPVLVFNNHSMPSGVTSVTSIGSYCLKGDEPLVGSGFKLLRVRYYHHDADAQSSSVVQWDIGSSYQTVPSANLYPAASPTSMSLPTFSETNSIIRYGLLDENSTIWQANGSSKPTTVIDLTTTANLALNFKITELDNCTGQPAPTTGPTCAATISADPCEVEVDLIDPCQCDKPGNIYANPANYRSVTLFKETAVVTSGTLTGFTIDSAYGIYDNTGAPIAMPLSPTSSIVDDGITTATFDFYSKPDENYEIFVADGTGTIVANLAGLCSEPNGCNCQEKPEVCGDNIDNDFDGLIDVADSDVTGNCTKNCPLTAVKVRGKAPVGDGRVTTQVWSQFTTPPYTLNYPATRNSSPVSSISGLKFPFSNTDVNGLPLHVNGAAGTITSGPLTGQSATHTNFSFFGLRDGTPLTRAYGLGGTKSEQVQMDAWIIVPPNATCFELRINNPIRLDATALYLGSSVTDLELIGESYSVGSPKTNMGDYRAPSGSETDINYEYNVNSDPNNALTSLGCGYRLLRARIYCYDAHQFIDARMMWNIGFGWQVIPTEYIQSVGYYRSFYTYRWK